LDPSARKAVWENLSSFKEEHSATVFFNTHYMDEADLYSDEAAIISRGRIVKRGTASELKRSLQSEIVKITMAAQGVDLQNSTSGAPLTTELQSRVLDRIRELDLDLVDNADIQCSILYAAVEDCDRALPQIIEVLMSEGIALQRISTERPTLDDVFLKYAGMRYTGDE
ncbi:MAG: DUF4162 domain-containing protein, partial [Methanotrichaceae archaeon]|nr:DUF4162 domain-containing protein [Methanotrichaceae archaeon]